jgi:hypothetical protein
MLAFVVAGEAHDGEAEELIEIILKRAAAPDQGHRRAEPVFRAKPPRWRWLRRRGGRRVAEVKTGWRIGCYYHSAPSVLGTTRIRTEFSHPLYLLSDGRLVVAAFRAIDAEGGVTELERPRQPSWFTPLDDSGAFFAARPGYYLTELKALHDDLV